MIINIISIGKIKEPYIKDAVLEYKKRLGPYVKIKELELKAESFGADIKEKVKKIEGERLLKSLEKYNKENIFLLDENEKEYSSIGFSRLLESKDELVFVVAGSLGWSDDLRQSSFKKISLSKMTFPHELARLLLFEQIYRGVTIIKGKDYHY
ncbi:23S rRNA (pseudouridine(1915)-N(3))-methyltransferase RlmH [Candidatus Parcubacteria bacterium]|nr:MAG: 23S rRNA (pseudouridine(1915)-N(3))-methyltransferase RlmH [Candidatus Parcubacteria bacterium]